MSLGSKQQMSPGRHSSTLCLFRRVAHGEDKASSWGGILVRTQGLPLRLGIQALIPSYRLPCEKLVLPMFTSLHLPKLLLLPPVVLGVLRTGATLSYCLPILITLFARLIPSPSPSDFPSDPSSPGASFVLFTIKKEGIANLMTTIIIIIYVKELPWWSSG